MFVQSDGAGACKNPVPTEGDGLTKAANGGKMVMSVTNQYQEAATGIL